MQAMEQTMVTAEVHNPTLGQVQNLVMAELQSLLPIEALVNTEVHSLPLEAVVSTEQENPAPVETMVTAEVHRPLVENFVTAELQSLLPLDAVVTAEVHSPPLEAVVAAEQQNPTAAKDVVIPWVHSPTRLKKHEEILLPAQCGRPCHISFASLCPLPKRIKTEVRKRKKPPSYVLTSAEHFEYIAGGKKAKTDGKRAVSRPKAASQSQTKENRPMKMAPKEKMNQNVVEGSGMKKNVAKNKPKQEKAEKEREFQKMSQSVSKNKMRKCVEVKQAGKKKQRATQLRDKSRNESSRTKEQDQCNLCFWSYGENDDPKRDDVWLQCGKCEHWYHETCAEEYGILDDSTFTCYNCF